MALSKLSIIAVSASALLSSLTASAGDILTPGETKFVLGAEAGEAFGNSNVRTTRDSVGAAYTNNLGGNNVIGGVLAGTEYVTKDNFYLGADLAYDWGGVKSKETVTAYSSGPEGVRLEQNGKAHLDFKFGPNYKNVVPYVLAGLSSSRFKLTTRNSDSVTYYTQSKRLTGVNLGLGALFPVTSSFALGVQGTYTWYIGKLTVTDPTIGNTKTSVTPRTFELMAQARYSI